MLTSFFGKSNPVNFLILGIFIFIGYVLGILFGAPIKFSGMWLAEHLFFIAVCVFSMLLVDFIIRKNDLTKSNTFGILFFSCFLVMLPVIFFEKNILLANIFLLLALRRVLSLKSEKNTEKKILDASLWITIASFFYFYCLLFFIVLFLAVLRKKHTRYKHLLIPFVGFLAVLIIVTAYHFFVYDSLNWFFELQMIIDTDFSAYHTAKILIPATIIVTFIIWTGIYRIFKLSSIPKKDKPNYLLMLVVTIISIFIVVSSPQKTGGELLFLLAPTAIITSNYIENIKEFWFRELLLLLVVLLPIVLLFI